MVNCYKNDTPSLGACGGYMYVIEAGILATLCFDNSGVGRCFMLGWHHQSLSTVLASGHLKL